MSEIVNNLKIKNYGIIIRTSAINATEIQIEEDIESVIKIYENVKKNADEISKEKNFRPTILFEKGNIVKRLLLDIGNQGLDRIVVNNKMWGAV